MAAGVYLHIPFCKSRCSYCDFATHVYRGSDAVERYVAVLCTEIGNQVSTARDRLLKVSIDTIYFGGGTPSLLKPLQVERILKTLHQKFSAASNSEITMEMNPATVTPDSLKACRSLGVNRASFGVQTFDDGELKRLARGHTAQDARDT
ncbi:MAG: radical SAM protein, partial [Acidobacteria bacterium]|nr:radical SAM protein [Acidobacteriota bacterium]MCA1608571.1 radical SAM protein [Acidobacteriota bacterium]